LFRAMDVPPVLRARAASGATSSAAAVRDDGLDAVRNRAHRRAVRPRSPRGAPDCADESVAAWGQRVLGAAATTWLVAPALQGSTPIARRAVGTRDLRQEARTARKDSRRRRSAMAN
jgi:hypothetical protein